MNFFSDTFLLINWPIKLNLLVKKCGRMQLRDAEQLIDDKENNNTDLRRTILILKEIILIILQYYIEIETITI